MIGSQVFYIIIDIWNLEGRHINSSYYWERSKEIMRENGFWNFAEASLQFLREKIEYSILGKHYQASKRTDNIHRWENIEQYISDGDNSALDIGCADGFFSNKLNEKGVFTVGIDHSHLRLQRCKKQYGHKEGLAFMRYSLKPGSVTNLPKTDVMLLLTVFHHWIDSYGFKDSKKMLQQLAGKTDKIFFELPEKLSASEKIDQEHLPSCEGYRKTHKEFIESLLGDVDIEFVSKTDYSKNKDREDLIFRIDCGGIEN